MLAAVVGAMTAGCSAPVSGTPAPLPPWTAKGDGAAAPGSVDLAATCPLPVTFTVAQEWVARPFDLAPDDRVGRLFRHGPFDIACEVDARPAGDLGFLRVYTSDGPSAGPRRDLQAFVSGENVPGQASGSYRIYNASYTERELGGHPAAEVAYETGGAEGLDLTPSAAFAVDAPGGPVVVQLDGLDADDLVPALELAMRTLRVP